ncbi:MAG TPA: NAD(P)-dependent oxidoreductase [Thermodesulfobacteriota bacterium]
MTNKVLVTGATGFIGRHCLPLLLERGYEVHAVTSNKSGKFLSRVKWHVADLLDLKPLQELILKFQPTHLLHLAWYVIPGKLIKASENLQWVQTSLDLLQLFQEHGGKRIVMAGSCYEYDWNYGYCSEFLTPRVPATFYGKCKNSLQTLLDAYSIETGLSSAWGRVFFVYGPHEYSTRLVSSVIGSILHGEPALCSHGNQIRDYLYVEDVADAFVSLLESEVFGPVNVGSGRPVFLKEIIFRIAGKLKREDLIRLGELPVSPNEAALVVADVNRLFDEVGWRPKYDLDHGLEQTIQWWKSQLKYEVEKKI